MLKRNKNENSTKARKRKIIKVLKNCFFFSLKLPFQWFIPSDKNVFNVFNINDFRKQSIMCFGFSGKSWSYRDERRHLRRIRLRCSALRLNAHPCCETKWKGMKKCWRREDLREIKKHGLGRWKLCLNGYSNHKDTHTHTCTNKANGKSDENLFCLQPKSH